MAICGGVNSIISPELFIPLSRARMASPTGQCHAFSSNADGYARGEGCGIVILKKLGDVSIGAFPYISNNTLKVLNCRCSYKVTSQQSYNINHCLPKYVFFFGL